MKDIIPVNIQRLEELISTAEKVVIVTHMKPDGDALGSSLSMYHFIKMTSKAKARVILPNPAPAYLDFLIEKAAEEDVMAHEDSPQEAEQEIASSDLIICLDFNSFRRTDKLEKTLAEAKGIKILVDHHLNPDRDSFSLSFSETEVSSASELVFHILMRTKAIAGDAGRLPEASAEAIFTGMTTDTNNFANSVYPSTMIMASELLAVGIDRDMILQNLYNKFSENRLRLLGHMLKDLLRITEDGVAYMILDNETIEGYNITEGDTEGFVNMPLSIEKVRMSILIKEDDGKARVSVRSKKGTSANRCAALYFNGGGHENAAGGRLNIPGDIADITEAAGYIETRTHSFMTEEI